MNLTKVITSVIVGLLLIVFCARSERSQDFKNLSIAEEISQNSISQILQDNQGMIWLATNAGLDKYIGNEIVHIKCFSKSLVEDITFLYDPGGDSILICTNTANYR
ncbi:MAG: hypothetical protein HUU45_13100, partial [Leptospiraceae bacterium]|nr:hypothetical protein [Leptospiraceae bacterium]